MRRFWATHIQPMLLAAKPTKLFVIGADAALLASLLDCAQSAGVILDIADPAPAAAVETLVNNNRLARLHRTTAQEAAAKIIDPPDFVLRDGDRNWWTVYQELLAIFERAEKSKPPIVAFMDAAWPYARRDMYYEPARVHIDNRQAYAFRGIKPGVAELEEGGLNAQFANAVSEGGGRNGVLTAFENFIAEWSEPISLSVLPILGGLGLAIPEARKSPSVAALLDRFFSVDGLMQACELVEGERNRLSIELQQAEQRLARRTEALERARKLLSQPKN